MRILVTGGLGFVGINLVRSLAQQPDVTVVAADVLPVDARVERFLKPLGQQVSVRQVDVCNPGDFRQVVIDDAITHIIHAAAITPDLDRERRQAPHIVHVNLSGALNALNIAYEVASVQRLLLVSSSGVYGAPQEPAAEQREDGALQLDNLYSITKYASELLAERFTALCGKPFASIRLGAVFGPMERPTGSRQNMSHIRRLSDMLKDGRWIKAAGPDIRRDWVFTADVSAAVWGLLCAPRWNYPVYNVGSGEAVDFRGLVNLFAARGLHVDWAERPEDADISMMPWQERPAMDVSRLRADVGFVPQFAGLRGIDRVLDLLE